jgi:iron(III) transport system substrate-binding protein
MKSALVLGSMALSLASSILVNAQATKLTVYSSRNQQLIQPVFDAYTKATGVQIEHVTADDGALIERLSTEGKDSPADILMTVDAGNLWLAAEKKLLAPTPSKVLTQNIPAPLRDPKNQWFAFSVRARTIFYNPEKVSEKELATYADLADKKFEGKLCLRTSKKVYNQSLVASFIDHYGKDRTEKIVSGWVKNLAAPVFSNDTLLLKAIDSGQCAVGLANTYYYARLLKEQPNLKTKIFWANQKQEGVHVNVSGAGITQSSKHKKEAQAFLEWLSQGDAQQIFASLAMEFPANPKVDSDPIVKAWGNFKQDKFPVFKAGKLQPDAVKLMDKAGYL